MNLHTFIKKSKDYISCFVLKYGAVGNCRTFCEKIKKSIRIYGL